MVPPPPASIAGTWLCMHRKTPLRLTAIKWSRSVSPISARGATGCSIPALLNAASSRPKLSRVAWTAPETAASEVTSQVSAIAVPPPFSIWRTVSAAPSSSMSTAATEAPARAKASAVARPMPLDAPVTKATLFAKFTLIVALLPEALHLQ